MQDKTDRHFFHYLIHEVFVSWITASLSLMTTCLTCSCGTMEHWLYGFVEANEIYKKSEQQMGTEKTPKQQFYDMNTADLHSSACRLISSCWLEELGHFAFECSHHYTLENERMEVTQLELILTHFLDRKRTSSSSVDFTRLNDLK